MLKKNGICAFNSTGKITNSDKDGNTSQNILVVSDDICSTSLVSIYNQHIANTETSGTDASNAPTNELILDISDIETINTAVMANFVKYQDIIYITI